MKHLLLLILGIMSCTANANADENIAYSEICGKNSCLVEQISAETPTGVEIYDHITVTKNCRLAIDYFPCDYEYYLRNKNGSIIEVTDYLKQSLRNILNGTIMSVFLERYFVRDIYDCKTITKSSWQYMYEKSIQKEKDRLCVVYKMKSPFIGEIKDCGDGRQNIINTINYPKNMITMKQAAKEVCEFMQPPENNRCEIKAFKVYTNKKSTYYEIFISRDLTPIPNPYPCIKDPFGHSCSQHSDNDYPIFKIDAFTGKITLNKILKNAPKGYDNW